MSLRHPKIKGINVAIKIIKPQVIPDRMVIAAALDVKMQFVFICGTITALIQASFMAAILEPYKWHQIKKSANGNIVFSDCLCNTLSKNCVFALSTTNPVKLRIKVDYKGYFPFASFPNLV